MGCSAKNFNKEFRDFHIALKMVSVNAHYLFYQLKALVLSMHTQQSSQGQPKKVTFNSYSV